MKKRAIFMLIVFLCLVNSYVYAQSDFILHEISTAAENDLELVGYHVNMVSDRQLPDDLFSEFNFQEYVFYNNGNISHKVVLGVWNQDISEMPSELFRINGVKVRHQPVPGDESTHFGFFVFIEVVFPAREETRIRVNNFSYIRKKDNSFIFRGSPRFTVTIGNRFIDRFRPYFEIEEVWINDIFFNRRSESLVSMLEQRGSLSNGLFAIRKTDGNTWEIEFTREFVDAYRSNLVFHIEDGRWGYTGGGYTPLWQNHRGFVFNSEEKITPYQYIFLTNRQLQVLRNSYYARHGFIFRDTGLGRMYDSSEFSSRRFGNINYAENPNFTEAMLTETDRANIATIQRLEALAGN
jgi:hypothetical protein